MENENLENDNKSAVLAFTAEKNGLPSKTVITWKNTNCTICGTSNTKVIRAPRINYSELTVSARKFPRRVHSQIVKCANCGLIFANPILNPAEISRLYADDGWLVEPQLENMKHDYLRELAGILPFLKSRDAVLEIGCANGFFLEEAGKLFKKAVGVEPSKAALMQKGRLNMINSEFKPGMFDENSFDLVCLFQVFDHLIEPIAALREIHKILKPGGIILAINHDIRSPLARLFGKNCSMYDIQHIYLFCLKTMRLFLEKGNFEVLKVHDIKDTYRLDYAMRMLPFSENTRNNLINLTKVLHIDNFKFSIYGGNMVAVGRKPD